MVKLMVFIALCAIIIILTMLYLAKFISDIIIHTAIFQIEQIEKPKWKTKAKSLLDKANQLKAYDNEGEQEWFEDVVAFLEKLNK